MAANVPDPKTLQEAIKVFADEDNCLAYMVAKRWSNGVTCPTCGSEKVGFLAKHRRWQCSTKHPKRQFSAKVGTIFEDSPLGLDKWLPVVWLITNAKNGVSSWEIHRAMGVTQKTAWFMLHRVRLAMQDEKNGGKLGGEVEVDETFIGGKARNMHKDRLERNRGDKTGGGSTGKIGVQGMLQRGGKVVAQVIENTRYESVVPSVHANIDHGSTVITDEANHYFSLGGYYDHQVINHMEAYVNGNVHTNGIENFWSLLKRTIGGTYVSVEPFHLFRYVDEQAFRFNNRKPMDDSERFSYIMRKIVGKRITYKELIGKEGETVEEPF
jgi:transposase-like protein